MSSDIDVIGESRYSSTAALIAETIDPHGTVVEIGATDASFRGLFPEATWYTVDKYGQPDVEADLDGPNCYLPFDARSVDVVICTEVLEHLVMGTPLVREMARIVKREGRVIVSVPNIASLKSRVKVLFGKLPNMAASGDCGADLGGFGIAVDGNVVGGHVVDYNEARLHKYLQRGGLDVVRFHKVPITVARPFAKSGEQRLKVASWLYPRTFADFILCDAVAQSDSD